MESGKLKERYIRLVSFFCFDFEYYEGKSEMKEIKIEIRRKIKNRFNYSYKILSLFCFFFFCLLFCLHKKGELYKLKVKHNKYQYIYKILYISLSVCVSVCIPDAALLLDNLVSYNTTIYILYIYRVYISIGIALSI